MLDRARASGGKVMSDRCARPQICNDVRTMQPRLWLFVLAFAGLLTACDRDSSAVQRQGATEGKAAQSAADGSANEGKAEGTAGRELPTVLGDHEARE